MYNKTLEMGFRGVILVGIGTAFADGVYSSIAALGFSTVSDIMNHNKFAVKLFGGFFLLHLAYKETGRINLNNEIKIKRCVSINTIIEAFS